MTTSRTNPPSNLKHLNKLIVSRAGSEQLGIVFRRTIATIVACQMLPKDATLGSFKGLVKGGTAMKLRMGRTHVRFSADLDVSQNGEVEDFIAELQKNLQMGWAGFTGRLVWKTPAKPKLIPAEYVMLPFEIKLAYKDENWTTVVFELGTDEIGDTLNSEYANSDELRDDFAALGLPEPSPIPLLPLHHQIAQKLHACSTEKNERAHDLVDLQLIMRESDIDLALVAITCKRLFKYRNQHSWPPIVSSQNDWDNLYQMAKEDLDVIQDLSLAVNWANNLIAQIEGASTK